VNTLTFVILCLEGALLSFNVAASAALVPSIARDFALSQFLVGKIVWIYMLPYGVAALLYGPLVRAFDAKKVELVCIVCFSLANLLVGISPNITAVFIGRFFMGVFGASVTPLALILIARHTQNQNRGKAVGAFFSATFISSLAGLFLSGMLPWRLIFLIPAVFGCILLAGMYFWLPSFKEDATGFTFCYGAVLKDKKIVLIFTYIFTVSLFFHGIQQWLGVYFSKSFGFTQFAISMLVTLTSLSGIFGEAVGGLSADTVGRMKTLRFGLLLMVIAAFLLMLRAPVFAFAIILMLWGLGWAVNHAGVSTMLTDLPGELINEAASLNSSVRFISGGLGAVLGGFLMQKSFFLGFGAFGVGLACLLLLTHSTALRLE